MSNKVRNQYRDAKTGKFISESQANSRKPGEVVKQMVPNPGHSLKPRKNKKS